MNAELAYPPAPSAAIYKINHAAGLQDHQLVPIIRLGTPPKKKSDAQQQDYQYYYPVTPLKNAKKVSSDH